MKDGSMESGLGLPETRKEDVPHWAPNQLSPWGRLGDNENGEGQIVINNEWVKFDENSGEYYLTLAGRDTRKERIKKTVVSSAYQEAMINVAGGNNKDRKGGGENDKKGGGWEFNYRGQLVRK